jgi:methionine biosynthesis protein MetW
MDTSHQEYSYNPSYVVQRNYIVDLIPETSQTVLDVGCSVGALGRMIKNRNPACKVFGIEINWEMAAEAEEHFDQVVVGDIEELELGTCFGDQMFDSIIFTDVLEHLKDPWETLKKFSCMLKPSGVIIISLPNISHYSTIINLVFKDHWPYRDRGIHDRTHLRFFTLKNIMELLSSAKLEAVKINRRYRIFESIGLGPLNRISFIFGLPGIRRFLTFQYLIIARKKGVK